MDKCRWKGGLFFNRRQSTKQEHFHSAEVLDSIAIKAVQS